MQYMQHNRGAEIFCTSKMGERLFKSRNCYQYIFALDIAKQKLAIFEVLWLFFAIKENRIKFFIQTFRFFSNIVYRCRILQSLKNMHFR